MKKYAADLEIGSIKKSILKSFRLTSSIRQRVSYYLAKKRISVSRKKVSVSGNRTPVARVTGGNTHHYTNTDLKVVISDKDIF